MRLKHADVEISEFNSRYVKHRLHWNHVYAADEYKTSQLFVREKYTEEFGLSGSASYLHSGGTGSNLLWDID
jgi:hypothetical protein